MKKTLYDYNDVHLGETIYVVGCSPSLSNLTSRDLDFLKDKTTIGVNFAYEGIPTLSYSITAHNAPAVYLFEFAKKEMPIFVELSGDKVNALSYMKEFFWNDERIITYCGKHPTTPLQKKRDKNDVTIVGDTSSLLLATHLAFIMGASQIIYIGFEELSKSHFWSENEWLESKMEKNMRNILETKKYFNRAFYDKNDMWSIFHNVHKEFQYILGDLPDYAGHLHLSEDQSSKSFDDGSWLVPSHINVSNFTGYVKYLNNSGIPTHTLSSVGITIAAGCKSIGSLTKD